MVDRQSIISILTNAERHRANGETCVAISVSALIPLCKIALSSPLVEGNQPADEL